MKIFRFTKPIAVWKEPRSFVVQHHPGSAFYGWMQFRIFVYVALGLWALLEIVRLAPASPLHEYGPLSWGLVARALGLAVLLVYGIPLLTLWMPTHVRLYSNFMTVAQGLHYLRTLPFVAISSYRFEKATDGHWLFRLTDVFGAEAVVAVPTDEQKVGTEQALAAAGVSATGLSAHVAATRRKVIEDFLGKAKTRHDTMRKIDRGDLPRILLGCAVTMGLCFAFVYLGKRHLISETCETVLNLGLIVLFFASIIWFGMRSKKRVDALVPDTLVICPHCHEQILLVNGHHDLPAYSYTLSCYRCGGSLLAT